MCLEDWGRERLYLGLEKHVGRAALVWVSVRIAVVVWWAEILGKLRNAKTGQKS